MIVHERALASTVDKLLAYGNDPLPLEALAELTNFSVMHTWRIVRRLEDDRVIAREGRGGRASFRYTVNLERAQELGLIHA